MNKETRLVERRIDLVQKLYLAGKTNAEIIKAVNSAGYDLAARTILRDISRVKKSFKKTTRQAKTYHKNKAINRLERLYSEMFDRHDFKGCLAVQDQLNKLLGLYDQPEAQEHQNINITYNVIGENAGDEHLTRLADAATKEEVKH